MHNTKDDNMESFRPIGTLSDVAADHRRKHGRYSDSIKADRIRLENTAIGADKKIIESKAPSASYFSESADDFRNKYIKSHKLQSDILMLKIMLCKIYNVDLQDLEGKSRKMPLPLVRKYVAFFCYYYFTLTHEQIAIVIDRERSTVTTHIAKAIDDLECYFASREKALIIDKFLHNICRRRKQNAL